MGELVIREARDADEPDIWSIYQPIVSERTTYALDPTQSREGAMAAWMRAPRVCLVAEDEAGIHGTYYIKANAAGPGAHVANAGFMTAASAQGRGVGRKMGEDALQRAKALGFAAMQFNMVAASNLHAVRLWRSLGFLVVGTLPDAFEHASLGRVDAFVMYRAL